LSDTVLWGARMKAAGLREVDTLWFMRAGV
jgi:hypothetical protein